MSRPTMGDPDYVYTPLRAEQRELHAAVARRRLGIPDGHRRICGYDVPEAYVDFVKPIAMAVRQKHGLAAGKTAAEAALRMAKRIAITVKPG